MGTKATKKKASYNVQRIGKKYQSINDQLTGHIDRYKIYLC